MEQVTKKDLEFLYNHFKEGMLIAKKTMNNPHHEESRIYQEGVCDALNGVLNKMYEYIHEDSCADYIGPNEYGDVDGKY